MEVSMKKLLLVSTFCILGANFAHAELVQQFKDPTFSGNGWTTQVLTLEQMRQSATAAKEAKAAAAEAQIKADAQNTPLAKFMNLFTGQVYSQLATQLSNNLFGTGVTGASDSGKFNVSPTQQIQWQKDGKGNVVLTVFPGVANSNGSFTISGPYLQQITVPINSFAF